MKLEMCPAEEAHAAQVAERRACRALDAGRILDRAASISAASNGFL